MLQGALKHVIDRGINRQVIFSDKAHYKDFLRGLSKYFQRLKFVAGFRFSRPPRSFVSVDIGDAGARPLFR